MKKLILTSVLSVLAFVGFSSAVDLSITSSNRSYNPSSYTLENDLTITPSSFSNVSCMDWDMISINAGNVDTKCEFTYKNGSLTLSESDNNCTYTAGTTIYFTRGDLEPCSSLTLNLGGSSSGGGSSSDSDSSTLLPNGVSELTPVVTGVSTIVGEFIPYVIYCSIGILLAILGFVAIKRLMNYMTRKITSIFSSKRRK